MTLAIDIPRLVAKINYEPHIAVGIGGNYYVMCKSKFKIECLCYKIEKAPSSIYWSEKYKCWTIRVKNRRHKERLKFLKGL